MNAMWKTTYRRVAIGAVALVGAAAAAGQVPYFENFESGPPFTFTSDHVYAAPQPANNLPGGPLWLTSTYTVDTDPFKWHQLWKSFGDHTTGTGRMMIVNAADTGMNCGTTVWKSPTITLAPNQTYTITYWVALSILNAPPRLRTSVNGAAIGVFDAVAITTMGSWTKVEHTWQSGSATSATIAMCDEATETYGDDYALDDISLVMTGTAQWCSPGYWRQTKHLNSWLGGPQPSDLYSFWIKSPAITSINTRAKGCDSKDITLDPTLWTVLSYPACYGGAPFNAIGDLLSDYNPLVNYQGVRVENCPLN